MTVDELVKATGGYYLSNKARSGSGVVIARAYADGYELTPEGHEMVAALQAPEEEVVEVVEVVEVKPVTRTRKKEK